MYYFRLVFCCERQHTPDTIRNGLPASRGSRYELHKTGFDYKYS